MNDLTEIHTPHSAFDKIRRVDDQGQEYWSARDLQPLLGYTEWRKFDDTIDRARISAANVSGETAAQDHFVGADKMIEIGKGGQRQVKDYHLSRYGAYLAAMNGDPRKPEVASAQTYFAIQARKAEVAAEEGLVLVDLGQLPETRDVRLIQKEKKGILSVDGELYYTTKAYYAEYPEWDTFSLTAMRGMVRYVCWGLMGHQKMIDTDQPMSSEQEGLYPEWVFHTAHRNLLALRGTTQGSAEQALAQASAVSAGAEAAVEA